MSIDIRNVSFSYDKKRKILDDISLFINDSTVNVLLGLNGCGKTTLIKAMAGLFRHYDGEILYDGEKLSSLSYRERSKIVAYVPQTFYGTDDVLVGDYLTFGTVNSFRFYELPKKEQLDKVYDISEKMHISTLLNKKLGEISGGERQTVCLCASLLQDSKVILLDEPTSVLDLKNQNLILTTLKNIAEQERRIIVLSSHNPNHALFLGGNVALMHHGKIIEYGNAQDIVCVSKLKQVYGENICLSEELNYKEISFCSV